MKYLFYIVLAFFLGLCSAKAQQAISWQTLSNVTWKRSYVVSMGGEYDVAQFGARLKALDKKFVSIKGFYVPIDMEGTTFALSKSQSSMCFFCGADGIESVIEIFVKKGHTGLKRVKTDQYIEIKGILELNKDDPNHLMYLLKDAELVSIVK